MRIGIEGARIEERTSLDQAVIYTATMSTIMQSWGPEYAQEIEQNKEPLCEAIEFFVRKKHELKGNITKLGVRPKMSPREVYRIAGDEIRDLLLEISGIDYSREITHISTLENLCCFTRAERALLYQALYTYFRNRGLSEEVSKLAANTLK